jgi:hypothetical protein
MGNRRGAGAACGLGSVPKPIDRSGVLLSVWVGDENQLVAAGHETSTTANPVVLRLDRNTRDWAVLPNNDAAALEEFWGERADDLWAAGTDWTSDTPAGAVVHFDGTIWTREAQSPGIPFHAIAGTADDLHAGGHYDRVDANGRLGTLLSGTGETWTDSGLAENYGIISLYAEENLLLAGAIRANMPTEDLTFEWLDITDPTEPTVLCADSQPIEGIAKLGGGAIVAVGHDGDVYTVEWKDSP